ncbi:MAG: DNA mismatch repair protein MutS, partial [Thermodesulfobacteriota bacterium]
MEKLTPAMRQYMEVKEANPDAIVFFRMGDFYEMFFDDARTASRVLGITLTSRDKAKKIPMCGFPFHAATSYIARLVREGFKVAVCEQVEEPGRGGGVVRRAVSRVVTPGVVFDDEILDAGSNNYIAAASMNSGVSGFSYMDASTGEFRATVLSSRAELFDEIMRVRPLELLVPEKEVSSFPPASINVKKITPAPDRDFTPREAAERLCRQFGTASLDGLGLRDMPEGIGAAGALLAYIRETQKTPLNHLRGLVPYHTHEFLVMDPATRRNLEITRNIISGGKDSTLLGLLDRTRTAIGARTLKTWLLNPLKDAEAINMRLDAVGELLDKRPERGALSEQLSGVYDLERLTARVSLGTAGPRDLAAMAGSLGRIPEVKRTLREFSSPLLGEISSSLDGVAEVVFLVKDAISDTPPVHVRDGGVIREGHSSALDELRSIRAGGKDNIARLEAAERERTGIPTLKVAYNRVFGYYIEVTRANLDRVPADYIRKQTLVGAERFITPALKEWEEKVLTAEEKSRSLEVDLFGEVVSSAAAHARRIQRDAGLIGVVDALASLAAAADSLDYTRPAVNDGFDLVIEGGRHPMIEANLTEDFIPNDIELVPDQRQIILLTGPNMAGKSTYLRQNALIVIMAQIGSYVPAARAAIGVVDRIFTRIGAADDLSRGQSTFMVEMNETANILNNATERSLVILDEIGRGTSTFDGLSIAWSVVEHLHDSPAHRGRTRTLFATHYHELTELSLTKERVR